MRRRYFWLLLVLLVSLLVGLPLRESGYSVVVFGAIVVAAVLAAALAASAGRRPLRAYLLGAVPVILISLKISLFGAGDGLALLGLLFQLGLLAFAAVDILIRLWGQERVTDDTVLGAICVYLLIGFVSAFLFGAVELVRPGSFLEQGQRLRPPPNARYLMNRHPELIYFSFATLTTVGYGDITPAAPMARVLAIFEAVLGQLYLTTFLAFLIGNYVSGRSAVIADRPGSGEPSPRPAPGAGDGDLARTTADDPPRPQA
jgi:hypothetical protein